MRSKIFCWYNLRNIIIKEIYFYKLECRNNIQLSYDFNNKSIVLREFVNRSTAIFCEIEKEIKKCARHV